MEDSCARSAFANIVDLAKKDRKREKRREKNLSVRFEKRDENLFRTMEFDPENASKSITEPGYQGIEYNEVPWDEEEYVELMWYEMPDLDEDDEITSLCKRIVAAGDYDMTNLQSLNGYSTGSLHSMVFHQRKLDRVQGLVYQFALKLNNRYQQKMSKDNSFAGSSGDTPADAATSFINNTMSKPQIALPSPRNCSLLSRTSLRPSKSSSHSNRARNPPSHSRLSLPSSTHSKSSLKNNSSHSKSSLRSSSHSKSSCSGRSSHTGGSSRSGRRSVSSWRPHRNKKNADKNPQVIKNAKSMTKKILPKNAIAKSKHPPRNAKCVVAFPREFDKKKKDDSGSSSSSLSDDDSSDSDSDSSSSSSSSDSSSSISSSDSSSSDSDAPGKNDCNDNSSTQSISSDSYHSDERNTDVLVSKMFRLKNDSSALIEAFRQRSLRAHRKRIAA